MITLAIDESGKFEQINYHRKFIGGIIYTGNDIKDEKNRLQDALATVCRNNGLSYPSALHMMDLKKEVKENVILDVKKYIQDNGKYQFVYIIKGEREREDYKNIADFIDINNISNLYEQMICEFLDNIVLYNDRLEDEKDYSFNIASRVTKIDAKNNLQIKKYRDLGYNMKLDSDQKEYRVYLLDNTAFKLALTRKIIECRLKKDIKLKLSVKSINYHEDKDINPFLYLSDIACEMIKNTIHERQGVYDVESSYNELKELSRTEPYIWVFDDIETLWHEYVENYKKGNVMDMLKALYDIKTSSSEYKEFYLKHWCNNSYSKLKGIIDINKLSIYTSTLEYIISKKGRADDDRNYDVDRAIFIGNELLKLIGDKDEEIDYYRFKIYDVMLRCYNHKGDIDQCYKIIDTIKDLKMKLSLEEFIDYMIRKTEIYDNGFDFNRSLDERLKLKDTVELLKTNNEIIANDLGIKETSMRGITQLGKVYSSIGQTYCFMKNYDEGFKYLKDALEEFSKDEKNTSITTSYILHLAIESEDKNLYERYVEKYIKGSNLKEQLNNIIYKDKDSFELYVYVKSLHKFYKNNEDYTDIVDKIYKLDYEKEGFRTQEHPWELIYRRIGFMYYDMGRLKEGSKMIERSVSVVKNPGITISLINKSSLLKREEYSGDDRKIKSILGNSDLIIKDKLPYKKYFEDYMNSTNQKDKKDIFIKKFTYMYN